MWRRRAFFLLLAAVFLLVPSANILAQGQTFGAPGSFTYIVPPGVSQLTVEVWGAGGGGGGLDLAVPFCSDRGGGGGGGGGYLKASFPVVPGQVFTVQVGLGGSPGNNSGSSGTPGGDSRFSGPGGVNLLATGGMGGTGGDVCNASGRGGSGGTTSSSPGVTLVISQNGGFGADGIGSSGGAGGPGFGGFGKGGSGRCVGCPSDNAGQNGRVVVMTTLTNNSPTAVNDAYSVDEGDVLFVAAPGVLVNDTDPESDTLSAGLVTGPANGTLSLNNNGSFFYTPNAGFIGIDSFTYQASDSFSSAQATVSITVSPNGTTTPSVKAVLAPGTIRLSDPVHIDMVLDNPFLAPGGGVDALETDCEFTPGGILAGNSVTPSPAIFTPDPAIINQGFQGGQVLYAVSQSGSNAPVTTTGIVYSMSLTALAVGQSTLNCTVKAIDATGMESTLPFVGIVVNVENLAAGTGNVTGVAHHSHKGDGGITINLLTGGMVIATTTTAANGAFTLSHIPVGTYVIRAESPGYMAAEGNVTVLNQQTVTKPDVTLLAGDLIATPPVVIDELDVVQLAISYGQSVPPAAPAADLNGDSVVGLADLNALAENLRKTGPINW